MNYKLLGKSGIRVSELSLGTMTFGEDWGWGASQDESKRIFDAYAEAGGNFLDTADGYTNGTSEKMVGEFVKNERSRWVITTKYSFNQQPGNPNGGGNHRKHMVEAVEGSLKRLGTDYIDLYWVHAWDRLTPPEEVMRGLDDLVRQGKVLYLGTSDEPAWVVSYSNALAELRGWTPFIALQVEYSLIERTPERDLLAMAEYLGLGITAWSPLASGILTGKYNKGVKHEGPKRLDQATFTQVDDRALSIAAKVKEVADEIGHSSAQVALAWVRQRGAIPIIGARKFSQFEDNLRSLEVTLSPEQIAQLNEASRIELGFPHEFLLREFVHNYLHGGLWDRLEKPWQVARNFVR